MGGQSGMDVTFLDTSFSQVLQNHRATTSQGRFIPSRREKREDHASFLIFHR